MLCDFEPPPVLVIYFNRPKTLERLLSCLSGIRPVKIFFSCDGPRAGYIDDIKNIALCKRLIDEMIGWDCQKIFHNSFHNLGCDIHVPKAIDWFFSQVSYGIILEDDCLVSPDFYRFSAELLEKYKYNNRVMNISAANFQKKEWSDSSYYYSAYPTNWGWATWARAWQKYDSQMSDLDSFLFNEKQFKEIIPCQNHRRFWTRFFKGLRTERYTFWDAKWVYAIWKNNGVSITPNANLVSNIGYGNSATHTKTKDASMDMPHGVLEESIVHPSEKIQICHEADKYLFETRYRPTLRGRLQKLIKLIFSS